MKHGRWLATLAGLVALTLVAAACEEDTSAPPAASGGGEVDCATVEFGCVEVASGEPVNIGTALVISGADSTLGLDSQHGVELAADYWGDSTFDATFGQVAGHDIEFTHEDELCSADGGQAAATALAADPSVVAVIGTSCSSAALGVADTILSEEGILLFSPSNTNPALTSETDHQPFYARTAHNDRIQGAIGAQFAFNELGVTTAATIADESPYTQGLVAAFEANFEDLGGTITGSEQVNSEDTNFESTLTSLNEGDPELLYFPIFVAACTQIVQQEAELAPDVQRMVADGCLSSDTLKNAGNAVDGVYASSPDISVFQDDPFYADEFIPAFNEQYGDTTSVFHAHAFDATTILLGAIEDVAIDNGDGSLSIPRQALRDAVFATNGYDGIIGTITCTELGDCATDVTIGIFQAPAWPVEGGEEPADAIYSDTLSLDDVL
ncbi:MAG TPA: branched-chain amino acid ABC transporter substrate-binding protein [Actinomycetota bacterium]|jgi:branched-chain amino acid transport system substrate-binding protein